MVSEPGCHTHCPSGAESMADQASHPSSGWDWDGMTQDERSRIEKKMDKLLEMVKSWGTYPSTAPAASTSAETVCHGEATAVALAPTVGVPSPGPGSSTMPSSSSGIPDASLVVAMDTTGLASLTPAGCSTEGPCQDAFESMSSSDLAAMPSATIHITSICAATASSEGVLDGDASNSAALMPDSCLTDGLCHDPDEDSLVDVSLELTTTHMPCVVPVPSPAKASNNTSSYATPSTELLGTISRGFCNTCELAWLLQVPPHPPDTQGSTGGLCSILLPFLLAPDRKPPWLLLGRELILRKEELEECENYASDNLTNEGKEVLNTGSRRWQLKQPWLSFRLVSYATVISHLIWERSKQFDPNGLTESIFVAPESHMRRFVANLSNTPTCSTFSEFYSTTGTWCFNDEISSVIQRRSGIQEVQRVSVFLDTSFGPESCVTGIPMQISDACLV